MSAFVGKADIPQCPLFPRKQTPIGATAMSALCQKRTSSWRFRFNVSESLVHTPATSTVRSNRGSIRHRRLTLLGFANDKRGNMRGVWGWLRASIHAAGLLTAIVDAAHAA